MDAPPYNTTPALAYQGGELWSFEKAIKVYRCPAEKRELIPTFATRANKMTSYLMNGAVVGFGAIAPTTYKVTRIAQQDSILLWQSYEDNPGDWNDGSSRPNEGLTRKSHKGN